MTTAVGDPTTAARIRRGPVRSRLGGLAVIAASPLVALAVFGLAYLFYAYFPDGRLIVFGTVFALVGGVCCVGAGLQMRLRDGWDQMQRDPRPPVVFLRPFQEDERMWYNSPVGVHVGAKVPKADAVRKTTAEAKIGRTLRSIGPFVAVGKPGDRFAPFGAARLYLDNDEWQNTVALLIVHAMAVVLQPEDSPGTMWELESVVQQVDPRRILMLVPNGRLRPLGYTRIRWLTGQVLPVPLPEGLACDAFMFDQRWTPRALHFGKKPRVALREFIDQLQQMTFPQERLDAYAAFVGSIRR